MEVLGVVGLPLLAWTGCAGTLWLHFAWAERRTPEPSRAALAEWLLGRGRPTSWVDGFADLFDHLAGHRAWSWRRLGASVRAAWLSTCALTGAWVALRPAEVLTCLSHDLEDVLLLAWALLVVGVVWATGPTWAVLALTRAATRVLRRLGGSALRTAGVVLLVFLAAGAVALLALWVLAGAVAGVLVGPGEGLRWALSGEFFVRVPEVVLPLSTRPRLAQFCVPPAGVLFYAALFGPAWLGCFGLGSGVLRAVAAGPGPRARWGWRLLEVAPARAVGGAGLAVSGVVWLVVAAAGWLP